MAEDIWVKLDTCEYSSHFRLCVYAQLLSRIWLFVTPWTVACQASLSMGFFQARILQWVPISFSTGSSQPRDQIWVSCVSCTGRLVLSPQSHLGSHIFCLVKTYSLCKTFPICYLFGEIFLDFLLIREYLIYCQYPFNYELV